MQVLITGAAGQVGSELVRLAPPWAKLQAFDARGLDISDADAVARVFDSARPDLVINAAAYTAVDKAEQDAARAHAVNAEGVANLARQAVRIGAAVFHLSTDYVFDGQGSRPYVETDDVSPLGVYGASKLQGEQQLLSLCPASLILRTSWVFGLQGHNFVKTMLRLAGEREQLTVVADQWGGPTPARAIAAALWQLAEGYRANTAAFASGQGWGCFHFSGGPAMTWHGFAEEIVRQGVERELIPKAIPVLPISTAEFPTPARRPVYSILDCSKLKQVHGLAQPDWREGLREVLQAL